jgi:AsmA protein
MSERDDRLANEQARHSKSERRSGSIGGQGGGADPKGESERQPVAAARRRKVPRWLLWTVGVLVFLIAGGVATLKLVFTPEKLRSMVEPRLEARINRDIELGAVNLRLFPRLAIRLSDLSVANPPEFEPQPSLAFDAVDVQVRLWPLLKKQLELGEVRLLGPVVRYEVLADGRTNFDDLVSASGDTTTDEPTVAAPPGMESSGPEAAAAAAFAVQELVVRDGRVFYSDGRTGRGASLALGGRLSAVPRAESRGRIESEGNFDLASIRALIPNFGEDSLTVPDIEFGYQAMVDLGGDSLGLSVIEARVGEIELDGSGKVLGLRGARSIALALESNEVDIADFIASLPAAVQPQSIEAGGRAVLSLNLSGPFGDGAFPEVAGALDLTDVSASHAEHGRLLRDGVGQATFTASSLSLPSFTGELLGRPFELQLAARDLRNPVVEGRFRGDLDIEELSRFRESETPAEGMMSVDVGFTGPVQERSQLRVTGPVELTDVVYRSAALAVPAEIDTMVVQLTGAGVAAENVPIKLGDSDLTVSLSSETLLQAALDPEAMARPLVEFSARSLRLNLSEIRADTFTVGYGQLVAARLAGQSVGGRDPGTIARDRYPLPTMPPLDAHGRVQIGEFLNAPLRALNVAFDVSLQDGVVRVEELQSQVYGGRLTGGLKLDLSGGEPPFALDYDLSLTAAQAGNFLASWTRLGQALSGVVDFSIRGSSPLDETLLPTPQAVAAAGQAAFRDGSFANFPLARELANKFKVDTEYVSAFKDLGGAFKIENGAFVVEEWGYSADDWTADLSGSAGLGGTLDLRLVMNLPPSALERASLLAGGGVLGGLVNELADSDEPLPVVLGVSGTITSPALDVDSQALQAALKERLGDTGTDVLRRLFRRPPPN